MYPLPHPIPFHDWFTIVYHSFVNGTGIAANLLLFMAIWCNSPISIK